jgi:uncharacterized protein
VKYLVLPFRLFFEHGVPGAPMCKYHPSCSQYASDAIRKHGLIRGLLRAAWRYLRCNPWSHGGVDYP